MCNSLQIWFFFFFNSLEAVKVLFLIVITEDCHLFGDSVFFAFYLFSGGKILRREGWRLTGLDIRFLECAVPFYGRHLKNISRWFLRRSIPYIVQASLFSVYVRLLTKNDVLSGRLPVEYLIQKVKHHEKWSGEKCGHYAADNET